MIMELYQPKIMFGKRNLAVITLNINTFMRQQIKYFDYLDAGLPIIAGLPLKMVECLEKKGVLINWKNGQYDFEYLRK